MLKNTVSGAERLLFKRHSNSSEITARSYTSTELTLTLFQNITEGGLSEKDGTCRFFHCCSHVEIQFLHLRQKKKPISFHILEILWICAEM